ncbi:MAG: hypothetical protein M0R22_02380 [Dehalococcoidia bacterium]|nr:hypothetical protein [Dehalococcoidia bacterium]
MKRALLVLCALVLLPGCSYFMPALNQAPKAYIDSISPAEVKAGEQVSFEGHGTDTEGSVVAYRWRSDRDGEIGTTKSFKTSSLSIGEHAIYLMVQDNNDAWSAEVRGSVTVLPAITAPAKVNSFVAAPAAIPAGASSTLAWNVSNAATVTINQGVGPVDISGSVVVTPTVTTTYTLTAVGGGATATAQVKVTVGVTELDIVSFEADPETVLSGDETTLSWEVTGATQVKILPTVGIVDDEGSVDVTLTGDKTHVFTLTATNGDETITETVEVDSYLEEPDEYTVTLVTDINRSGYVRSNGDPWAKYIYVGDDNNNISLQGFVTFDISDIPDDAEIASVKVDLSDYSSPYGTPFEDFGCMRIYVDNYGTLGAGDYYDGSPTGAIGRYCDLDDINEVAVDADFKDALQDAVGDDLFQLRFQFDELDTDDENDNDLLRWETGNLPKLVVKYYSFD